MFDLFCSVDCYKSFKDMVEPSLILVQAAFVD